MFNVRMKRDGRGLNVSSLNFKSVDFRTGNKIAITRAFVINMLLVEIRAILFLISLIVLSIVVY